MSNNIKQERSKRNFRKVKSLNLRKPEDLEKISQGVDDLISLMKLKQVLASGEVFDDKMVSNARGEVLKNKMKLNAQASARSSAKLSQVSLSEDAAEIKEKLQNKQKSTLGEDKKKSSIRDSAIKDEIEIDIPGPDMEALNDIKPKQNEWDDIKPFLKEEFWKESDEIEGEYHYGIGIKGWRKTMEDTMDTKSSISPEIPNLFGVFDGHGGDSCAKYCQDFLLRNIAKSPELTTKTNVTLENVFTNIHQDYCASNKDGKEGSTATALIVLPIDSEQRTKKAANNGVNGRVESSNPKFNKKNKKETTGQRIYNSLRKAASLRANKREFKFYCACVGDSRAVLIYESGKVVPLSVDHNLRRRDELERIRMSGGEIRYDPKFNEMLVYSESAERGLNVTRSIGDSYFKPWVMHLPEIKEGFLTKDAAYFVIASDGLWSHVRNKELGSIMMDFGIKEGVKNLANLSNKRGCYDNCSIMAVDVKQLLKKMNEKLDE